MNLYHEKENAHQLLSDIAVSANIHGLRIEDCYDTSDWIGCLGCRGNVCSAHSCEWCDYIKSKTSNINFKMVRFAIDKRAFHNIKLILDKLDDRYQFHNSGYINSSVQHQITYSVHDFKLLKNNFILAGGKSLNDITEPLKLQVGTRILNLHWLSSQFVIKYNNLTPNSDNVQLSIKMSTSDIHNKLRTLFHDSYLDLLYAILINDVNILNEIDSRFYDNDLYRLALKINNSQITELLRYKIIHRIWIEQQAIINVLESLYGPSNLTKELFKEFF